MKNWDVLTQPLDAVNALSRELGVSLPTARVLFNRGLTEASQARFFLNQSLKDFPDPFLLKDMRVTIARIIQAIESKEKIVIYGDYDVDGTSATSMLMLFFAEIGYPIFYYIPHRIKEGYSLNLSALEKLKNEGANLIITVDNGIAAVDEVAAGIQMGMDIIITDHHQIPKKLPPAFAIINPLQAGCEYPDKHICGTGVAFNLIMALRQALRQKNYFEKEPNLKKYLEFVALATVADVVPLVGINRLFVRYGLASLQNTEWPGFFALCQVSGLTSGSEITAHHLGFRLGPRINAAGRLYDASLGVRLLTTQKKEEAFQLADTLNQANDERRVIEEKILDEALLQAQAQNSDPVLVLKSNQWHAGVLGIVASRLVHRFSKPVILLTEENGLLKGSARSISGIHLVACLKECESLLEKFGGHEMAAGLTLKPENLVSFKEAFGKAVAKNLQPRGKTLSIDALIGFSEIEDRLLKEMGLLGPFGQGNPEPLFCLNGIKIDSHQIVGKKHVKFYVSSEQKSIEAIAFGMAERFPIPIPPLNLVFRFRKNTFKGQTHLVLEVADFQII
ncbi:MAG: single-stranded-DNA-specific exonuclease RecJ [Deltaproteobacteria bacterium RIFCSPLOWO2_12_FULL_40_28]|nr:MAG: single-stranded-DNA-specific exonuclease RecJ [Deltaproteobacteria bacterium RIFCSPHIGHO2_02_FULL_40_28]OGQ18922.1 MAG: single-stranded-DNA-specific exonuclease RecJ [Deltaproteobacteria bacterium RIFCSPHIGHO2_12_FULL_40_32]OGQ39465.1 MAG: single-stranded-DNA-specific exonuclease RecJ [Deltaproteobacteria bacterium RIFCSPLOWO2_02_FULL_40_36]OGQ53355.1 MAG: single-stranded-DNA-specific exonuclease RecJ [Deltaproteobacteria bacterium RIFCSPLOWO2_12_FULL_40_28]